MCLLTSAVVGTALSLVGSVISSTAPAALTIGSGAAALGSTAMGVVGSIYSSKAQQAQANYQAQVAEQNRKIALKEAAEERQAGLESARTERLKALSAIGSQKAAMAANGMSIGEGSALDTIEDTAMLGELNALNVQYNAEQKAINYEQQASNFQNEINLRKFEAANARTSGMVNAVSAGLNGLADTARTVSDVWGGFSNNFTNIPKRQNMGERTKVLGTTSGKYAGLYNA